MLVSATLSQEVKQLKARGHHFSNGVFLVSEPQKAYKRHDIELF